jgi:hypothetical protein
MDIVRAKLAIANPKYAETSPSNPER